MHINLSHEEKKVLILWALIGILLLGLAIFLKIVNNRKSESSRDQNYTIVTDYSRYYTVSNALTKFYSFINAKDYEGVLSILGAKYLSENNINEQNIGDYITFEDYNLTYRPQIICQKVIDQNNISYYVGGNESKMNSGLLLEDKYYEVILNSEKFIFSIVPLDEEEYVGECHAS